MTKTDPDTYIVKKPEQRKAMTSPIRLEILGHFMNQDPMSIAEIAERMGRPAGSLYYHFEMLERVGLLKRTGVRPKGKRDEALFQPVAPRFAVAVESSSQAKEVIRTMTLAFRMAERDMESAMLSRNVRAEGEDRNFFATRMHFRTTRKTLAEVNRHLQSVERILFREARRRKVPKDADQYCSLTLALLPLRGRGSSSK